MENCANFRSNLKEECGRVRCEIKTHLSLALNSRAVTTDRNNIADCQE